MVDDPLPVLRAVRDRSSVAAALTCLAAREGMLDRWRDGATAYVLSDLTAPPGDDTVGVALCSPMDTDGHVELLGLAVREGAPGAGPRLVNGVANAVRAAGGRRLVAGVEPADVLPLAVLAATGFRSEKGPGEGSSRFVLGL